MKKLAVLLLVVLFNCSPEPIEDGSNRLDIYNDCFVVNSVSYSGDRLKDITVIKFTDWQESKVDSRFRIKLPVTNPDIIKMALGQKICDLNELK